MFGILEWTRRLRRMPIPGSQMRPPSRLRQTSRCSCSHAPSEGGLGGLVPRRFVGSRAGNVQPASEHPVVRLAYAQGVPAGATEFNPLSQARVSPTEVLIGY